MYRSEQTIQKQEYLYSLLKVLEQFQYTRSPEVLISYTKKNRDKLKFYIDSLKVKQQQISHNRGRVNTQERNFQDDNVGSRKNGSDQKQLEQNLKLENEYLTQLQISKGNSMKVSQIRFHQQQQQIDSILFHLKQKLGKLTDQNKSLSQKFEKMRFYKQFDLMQKEVQGAKKLNTKLKDEIQRRKMMIKEAKNKKS